MMIRHKQTIFEDGRGDCFRTCIACLIDAPLEAVPNFKELKGGCFIEGEKWLAAHGYSLRYMYFKGPHQLVYFCNMGPCILSGLSPRSNADGTKKNHAVVGNACGWGVQLIHDPHPSDQFLNPNSPDHWVYFIGRGNGA